MTTETVILDSYAYGGECFGRLADNRAVFVPYVIPGELACIHLVEQKKGFARGALIDVLEPSPDRIEPRCPHFTFCGGCHYQHIPYKVQLDAKTEIIRDQLRRIGKIDDPPLRPIVPSPVPWNYRNHVQFHLTPGGDLGFQAPRSHEVIPIKECHLLEDTLAEVWPLVDLEPIPGLNRIGFRVGAGESVALILESSDPLPVELTVDLPLSVIHSSPEGSMVLAGDDYFLIEVIDRIFKVSAGSFFQVNTRMAELMVVYILENLTIPPEATLLDAYCGVGLFSAFLAPHVNRLIAIEASPRACEDFVTNLDEFTNVELYEAPVGDVLSLLETKIDIALVDPPRAGLDLLAMDGLLSLRPEVILYISCDPATLSRDARRLTHGSYRLAQITPFDLFPQTYHIESISFWELC